MVAIRRHQYDVDRIAGDRLARGISVSMLISARGERAAGQLGPLVEATCERWMIDHPAIDEIGVLIQPDEDGRLHDMRRIARSTGASWVVADDEPHRPLPALLDGNVAGIAGMWRNLAYLASGTHLLFVDPGTSSFDVTVLGDLIAAACADAEIRFAAATSFATELPDHTRPTSGMIRSVLCKQLYRHVPGINHLHDPVGNMFLIEAELFASLPLACGWGAMTALQTLALDAVGEEGYAQLDIDCHDLDLDDLALTRHFHEVGVTVDVIERHLQLRAQGENVSAEQIAEQYEQHFPGRTEPLIRPVDFSLETYLPHPRFFAPLMAEPLFQSRLDEIELVRWQFFTTLQQRVRHATVGS